MEQENNYSGSEYKDLFDYMFNEHGLTLLQSELADVIHMVHKFNLQSHPNEWDSNRLIGRVKDRFIELEEKQWDWPSFYNGWIEGRSDMLQQIKGWGQYKPDPKNI